MHEDTKNLQNQEVLLHENIANKGDTVRLIIRTVASFLVLLMLFCAIFTSVFPYRTMRLYFNANMHTGALRHARRVVRRYESVSSSYDSRFMDGLFLAATLTSDNLQNDIEQYGLLSSTTQASASIAYNYLYKLLHTHGSASRYRMQNVIDPVRISSGFLLSQRPSLYRYEGLMRSRYIISAVANNTIAPAVMRIEQQLHALAQKIGEQVPLTIPEFLDEITFTFIELHAFLSMPQFNASAMLIYNSTVKPIKYYLQLAIPYIVTAIEYAPIITEQQHLRRTWWALHLVRLSVQVEEELRLLSLKNNNTASYYNAHRNWSNYTNRTFSPIAEDYIYLSNWYSLMLHSYIARR